MKPLYVKVYCFGKLRGQRTCYDMADVADAVGSVMQEEGLHHCAARFEDAHGGMGGWLLVDDGVDPGIRDVPPKAAAIS